MMSFNLKKQKQTKFAIKDKIHKINKKNLNLYIEERINIVF